MVPWTYGEKMNSMPSTQGLNKQPQFFSVLIPPFIKATGTSGHHCSHVFPSSHIACKCRQALDLILH